jgi:hypothetical protein
LKLGHFEDEDSSSMTDDAKSVRQTRWELGSAFEEAVRHGLARRYSQDEPDKYMVIGELEDDGLIGSPDLADLTEPAVHEIKLTWMSNRRGPEDEKFWKYLVQLKAYVRMFKQSRVGYLHVCFLNGDYSYRGGNSGPDYRVWRAEFTQQELDENWRMLQIEGRQLREEAKRGSDTAKMEQRNSSHGRSKNAGVSTGIIGRRGGIRPALLRGNTAGRRRGR